MGQNQSDSKGIVEKTFSDLKSMKVQGASNVSKAIVETLQKVAETSQAKNENEFREDFEKNALYLLSARPTEPNARAAALMILNVARKDFGSAADIKTAIVRVCEEFEKKQIEAVKKVGEYGANLIPEKAVILTHCHSETVEGILFNAQKKISKIYCTETRPKLQGRITAQHLAEKGFDVTMIVDSAAASFLKQCDLFISGADAILADGSVVNKIGTSMISCYAKRADVPHYVATTSYKFDPTTYFGIPEEIEERPSEEVWDSPPKNLKIRNPAFDITDGNMIKEIITEKGVFSPRMFAVEMYRELELEKRKDEYLEFLKKLNAFK